MSDNPLLLAALAGLATSGLFWLWRKSAARWSNWFPLLKKTLEFALYGLGLVCLYLTYKGVFGEGDQNTNLVGYLVGLAVPSLAQLLAERRSPKEAVKRGASVADIAKVKQEIRKKKEKTFLEIGGLPIPISAEPYHMLIGGSTGTGKSVAISAILDKLRSRNDTVILVDSGGEFLAKHYNPETDFVFNPFDSRCVAWSPLLEMQGAWDAEALARSIIPDGHGDSKEWNSYAQTLVASVLRKLWEQNRLTLKDFLYSVCGAPISELQVLLQGTAAAAQLGSEKTFGSIRTIASNYVTAYGYLPEQGTPFSVSEMIRAEHSGTMFLTYRDDQLDSLRQLMACILDVAARTILSLPAQNDRRVWLVIDEFASIGKVQSIEAVATKARKAGGCLLIGIQSISQLRDRYGEHGAQTILSCLSTWLVLRCADADTSEYMSKYIGEVEITRTHRGSSSSDSGESTSWNEQQSTQRAILPSELQQLPNLHGFVKLAGNYPVCEVTLPIPEKRSEVGLRFDPRDFKAQPLVQFGPEAQPKPAAAPAPNKPVTPARTVSRVVRPAAEPAFDGPKPVIDSPVPTAALAPKPSRPLIVPRKMPSWRRLEE